MTMPFLILKANAVTASDAPFHTDLMVAPETIDAFLEANPLPLEVVVEDVADVPAEPVRLGPSDRLEEARRFADMGKAMRLIDPERPHEAHLVGPDLADPHTWRHTLLVDDQPFTDREFDQAEDAFLSALQTGVVPAEAIVQGHTGFDLDKPFALED